MGPYSDQLNTEVKTFHGLATAWSNVSSA